MPAKLNEINLIRNEQSLNSPVAKTIAWITTYGRYIMVTTELIVLGAFLSRFSLDRNLTDLKEEISMKQEIIQANTDIDTQFRRYQDALKKIKSYLTVQSLPMGSVKTIHALLPSGTYFETLAIADGKISGEVTSLTVQSFSQFLINISETKSITNTEIGTINKETSGGILYSLKATIPGAIANTK